MGRAPCFSKSSLNRGSWSPDEDMLLKKYVETHGVERWSTIAQNAGLRRSGKSCRLRWMNYLRPNVKLGHISAEEEELIIRLHKLLGNRWSLIAGRVPGRTDNEVKNYWNIHLSKKLEKQSKIPIRRRNFRGNRSLETTDSEDPMGINSTDEDGNLNSRSVHAAATNTPQFSSPRDSTLTTPRDHNGPHRSDFCQCDSTVTDELIHTTIPSPVLDQVDISYEIRKMEGANDDQGVSTNGFENLRVESPCSDLYLSSVYSWADTLPWINGSVEMQDQWFHCSYI